MNRLCDWFIITMKDNRTKEMGFLKNESYTMMTFVSESQSQNTINLGSDLLEVSEIIYSKIFSISSLVKISIT